MMYRRVEINRNTQNRPMLRQKTMTDSQYSQSPLYGRLCSRIEVMPVPMVAANQDGVKFNTTRLHPLLFFAENLDSSSSLAVCAIPS